MHRVDTGVQPGESVRQRQLQQALGDMSGTEDTDSDPLSSVRRSPLELVEQVVSSDQQQAAPGHADGAHRPQRPAGPPAGAHRAVHRSVVAIVMQEFYPARLLETRG
jgi:hypothetical protein